jgi:hypothetical protein
MKGKFYTNSKVTLGKLASIFLMAFILQACGGSSNDTPQYSISADLTNIEFSTELGQVSDQTIAINISFNGEGLLVGFPTETQPVPWLKYRTESITENSATIYIDVVNAEFFPADSYNTKIRLTTGNETEFNFVHHDIDVSLLIWQLATNTDLLSFRGTLGDDNISAQTFEISSESNQWTATTDVSWLSLDLTSGTGSATITVTPTITSFTQAGLQQANITITETTTNKSKILPVELGLDNLYLFADQANIALTATTNIQTLEKTISISSNKITDINWQASTTATWLTLLPVNGTKQLSITADASLVTNNETSTATIVISAVDDTSIINETITVSLYKSDLIVENNIVESITPNTGALVNAPLLPFTYIGVNNELRVYHQYNAELVNSVVIAPELVLLDQFIIHPNGSYLFARAIETIDNGDGTTEVITHRYKVNLTDFSFIEIEDVDISFEPLRFVRLAGRYFVVTQILEFADENLKRLFIDNENAFFAPTIDQATLTGSLFASDNNLNNGNLANIKRITAQVNDFTQEKITSTITHSYHPETFADDGAIFNLVVSNDEKNIYLTSATSEWISFDGNTFTDNGLLETNADIFTLDLAKSTTGQPHYLRIDPTSILGFYVDIYNDQQTITTKVFTNGAQPTTIEISSDNKRLVINAQSSQRIEFVTIE